MGVYKKAIITDAGEALRARAVAGEASMQFSHAKTSTYVYPDGTDLTKLTDLQEIRQTVIPSNVQIANDTLISVRSLFGNEQINEAYLIQNVGVYATDGENEILFAVCQAITPDQMPAYDGVAPSSFIYNVQLTVSQAAQISLVVNTAGTATTQDVLELEQKKVNGNGGDISETVIAATEKSQAEYPVPAAGDSAKTVLGKVQKFFGDLRNWMTGVCLLGQIVNNCVTDNAKLPLSAAQGKVLMDLYNVLNTNLLSGIQCTVVNCSTDVPALYPWNTDSYANSLNFLVALGTDSNNFSVYSVGGTKNIICIKEFDGYTNTPRLYIADNKIYVNLKDHKISYQVLIVRFGKLLE